MDPIKPTSLLWDADLTAWIAGLPAALTGQAGSWKQTSAVEATHLPFVQVLIGFTRPERGIERWSWNWSRSNAAALFNLCFRNWDENSICFPLERGKKFLYNVADAD